MPLLYTHHDEQVYIKVWKIEEHESFFQSAIESNLIDISIKISEISNPHFRLRYLASRFLLVDMLHRQLPLEIYKSVYGKIYLKDSHTHVSISHTGTYVAVAVADIPVGIDIEETQRDVLKVKHKFVNHHEASWATGSEDFLHIWCSKEVVYKIYEKKELDFKTHMTIGRPVLESSHGYLENDHFKCEYVINKKTINNLLIVWGFGKDIVNL